MSWSKMTPSARGGTPLTDWARPHSGGNPTRSAYGAPPSAMGGGGEGSRMIPEYYMRGPDVNGSEQYGRRGGGGGGWTNMLARPDQEDRRDSSDFAADRDPFQRSQQAGWGAPQLQPPSDWQDWRTQSERADSRGAPGGGGGWADMEREFRSRHRENDCHGWSGEVAGMRGGRSEWEKAWTGGGGGGAGEKAASDWGGGGGGDVPWRRTEMRGEGGASHVQSRAIGKNGREKEREGRQQEGNLQRAAVALRELDGQMQGEGDRPKKKKGKKSKKGGGGGGDALFAEPTLPSPGMLRRGEGNDSLNSSTLSFASDVSEWHRKREGEEEEGGENGGGGGWWGDESMQSARSSVVGESPAAGAAGLPPGPPPPLSPLPAEETRQGIAATPEDTPGVFRVEERDRTEAAEVPHDVAMEASQEGADKIVPLIPDHSIPLPARLVEQLIAGGGGGGEVKEEGEEDEWADSDKVIACLSGPATAQWPLLDVHMEEEKDGKAWSICQGLPEPATNGLEEIQKFPSQGDSIKAFGMQVARRISLLPLEQRAQKCRDIAALLDW